MQWRWLILGIGFLVGGLGFFGCSNSQSNSGEEVGSKTKEIEGKARAVRAQHLIRPGRPAKVEPGESLCRSARAIAGSSDNVITISAQCTGAKAGGNVHFVVERFNMTHPNRRNGLGEYRQVPKVFASNSVVRTGHCTKLRGKTLVCYAQISGSAQIETRLWTSSKSRCADGVSVSETVPEPCTQETCFGNITLYQLFRGRPKGC
jgi:hypothetical protein